MSLMIIRLHPVLSGLRLRLIATMLAVSFALPSLAQDATAKLQVVPGNPSAGLLQRYPAGSIQSIEAAGQALADVGKERSRIEVQFANEQRACHENFFATSCLDTAKEQRRHALAQIRSVEIEANAFKRRARAAEEDRILAGKRAEQEGEALKRKNNQKDSEVATAGSAQPTVKKEADGKQRIRKSAKPDRGARDGETADNAVQPGARHSRSQGVHSRTQAEEAADAQKRAENVAAYERKVQNAEARQREVAAKKAEKERKRAKKKAASASGSSQ